MRVACSEGKGWPFSLRAKTEGMEVKYIYISTSSMFPVAVKIWTWNWTPKLQVLSNGND